MNKTHFYCIHNNTYQTALPPFHTSFVHEQQRGQQLSTKFLHLTKLTRNGVKTFTDIQSNKHKSLVCVCVCVRTRVHACVCYGKVHVTRVQMLENVKKPPAQFISNRIFVPYTSRQFSEMGILYRE
jgi:hypothetical protein